MELYKAKATSVTTSKKGFGSKIWVLIYIINQRLIQFDISYFLDSLLYMVWHIKFLALALSIHNGF